MAPLVHELRGPPSNGGSRCPNSPNLFTEWTRFPAGSLLNSVSISLPLPLLQRPMSCCYRRVYPAEATRRRGSRIPSRRRDVHFDANRNNIIVGMRNMGMSLFGPDASMCGPMWAAMQVVECERYKHGRKQWTVLSWCRVLPIGTFFAYFLMPIVSLVKPILPIRTVTDPAGSRLCSRQDRHLESQDVQRSRCCRCGRRCAHFTRRSLCVWCGIVLCALIYGRDFFP